MIIRKKNQTELITAFVSDKGPFGSVPLNLDNCMMITYRSLGRDAGIFAAGEKKSDLHLLIMH